MPQLSFDDNRPFAALRAGSLLLPLLAALVWGLVSYRTAIDQTRRHAIENVAIVAQYVERLVQVQTVLHRAAVARVLNEPPAFLTSESLHVFLRDLEATQPGMYGLAVVSPDGRLLASSRNFPVKARFGARSYLAAIAAGQRLFIDRLTLQPMGVDAVIVASPLPDPAGGAALTIVSSIATEAVAGFLRGVTLNPYDAASITREDGLLLVRNFASEPMMLPQSAPFRAAIAFADHGTFTAVAASDQIERLYAYRKLEGLPLYAAFGTPTSAIMSDWLIKASGIWMIMVLVGLLIYLTQRRARLRLAQQFELEVNRKRLQEAERLAEQRIRLMRETNHRVKNNLSLIVSLINMQMRGTSGIDGNDLKARIGAISRVHDLMYQAADGVHVDFAETLREIAGSPAIVPKEQGIDVICHAEPGIILGPETTTPLAIIAAELLTNAVKHAFRDRRQGTIRVTLTREGDAATMEVADDGVGLPAGVERRSGAAIVDALVHQIGGSIDRRSVRGAVMRVRFPLPAG